MNLLVLATGYPDLSGNISMYYVHTRNLYYAQKGISVNVLSFTAKENYQIDEIQVLTYKSYISNIKENQYDILICHAPNIRNHYKFLKKYSFLFPKIVFFFHGHEVLKISKVYSKPYAYEKKKMSHYIQNYYDDFKLSVWRKYLPQLSNKAHFIFVSEWMKNQFLIWTRISEKVINDCYSITYNSVGELFEEKQYELQYNRKYDFITIRNNLDGSKYAIDIVCKMAELLPEYSFCIIGCGNFFKYNKKPENVFWIEKVLNHNEIVEFLNESKCAFLPTRTDAQGVMACEMATYGIPLITSNIDVCKEVFKDFGNVKFIDNEKLDINKFKSCFKQLCHDVPYMKNTSYFKSSTCESEVNLFTSLINNKKDGNIIV